MFKIFILIVGILAVSSCRADTPSSPPVDANSEYPYHGINLEALGTYQSTFFLQFDGARPWIYKVDYRSDGELVERILHIDGVDTTQNPGDVRMVNEGDLNYMSGPGTDGECLVFSTSLDIGPAFLLPDQLLAPDEVNPGLQELGYDEVAGLEATRWGIRTDRRAGWTDVLVDIWQENPNGPILRYDLQLTGDDPFFGHGSGEISGQYIVQTLDPPAIEPISGCGIEFPIPESAENLLKIPGLLAFDSAGSVDIAADFYYENLIQDDWSQAEEPAQAGETLILSFQKNGRELEVIEVIIEGRDSGVHVELFTDN